MNKEIKNLDLEIENYVHEIYSLSLLHIMGLTEDNVNMINLYIFKLWRAKKELVKQFESKIKELEKQNELLSAELFMSELALDKCTNGKGAEEISKITSEDIIKNILSKKK